MDCKTRCLLRRLAIGERPIKQGLLAGPAVPYVTNELTIVVAKGIPGHIETLNDLCKKEVRPAMPNPEFEGVARQIKASLQKAGGSTLDESVYGSKIRAGTTIPTYFHHRQTPLFLMQRGSQLGA